MPDPMPQLHANVTALVAAVQQLTGRKSAWSGRVLIGTELNAIGRPAYFGAKPWNCDIVIHQDRLTHPGKYSTLLHEIFHSFSVGLNEPDFQIGVGWEEGTVEACTRLFRNVLLAAASLPPPVDTRTSYNPELALLEILRLRAQKAEADFYILLLATPLSNREAAVLQWIQQVEPTKTLQQIEQETALTRTGLTL